MKNFLLERLSSEPDKSIVSRSGDGSTEYKSESRDESDIPSSRGVKNGETLKQHHSYSPSPAELGGNCYAASSGFYKGSGYSSNGLSSGNVVCGKDQQTNRILELYDEYKTIFKTKSLSRVEKIVMEVMELNRDSPLIHLIHGEMFLYRGNVEKSRHHLTKYIESAKEPDDYALFVIAVWNDFMDYKGLALRQYTACLDSIFDTVAMSRALFNLACIKKRLKFLDTSIIYFNRLMATPEGFQLLPCIQLQIIHVHILKKNRGAAVDGIRRMNKHIPCSFVRRLRAYLDYTEKNYEAVLNYRDSSMIDPYICYLIGRIGSEISLTDIDVPHCFDESLRNSSGSPIIYNSYGNHYFRMGRYSDAATQYKNALAISPHFKPALDNMSLLHKAGDMVYTVNSNVEQSFLSEADPDVDEMGFLFVWNMLGYTQFKGDVSSLGLLNIPLPHVQ